MNFRALLPVMLAALLTLSLPAPIAAQVVPALCEIAFAPLFVAEASLAIPALPTPAFTENAQAEAEIAQYLLSYSSDYLAQHYDSATGMTRDANGSLDTRATMISSFVWAESGDMERAVRGVQSVLDSQVLDAASPQFGNFIVRAGETDALDPNWSAFIGSFLLVFHHRYLDSLPESLQANILQAVSAAAAHRLCQRYEANNNVALLSSFLLLEAGNLLQNDTYWQAGWALWNRVAASAVQSGFAEYNSPNYYKVDLYALGFMTDYSGIPELATQANAVRDLLWWNITRHYHVPTGNLAGPYSRTLTDRMSYELSGIQPFLYRESLGRIPLPAYPDYERNEQALHAILARLIKRSWREDWLDTALAPIAAPRQIREQVSPYHEGVGSAQQMTTYLSSRLALGSISADNPSGNARFLLAQAADSSGENMGVFRLLFPSTSGYPNSAIKITQNMRSVLGVVQLTYPAAEQFPSPLEWTLEWFGTESNLPQAVTVAAPAYNQQFDVRWMDTTVSLLLDSQLAPPQSLSELIAALPSETASQLALHNRFTLNVIPEDVNPEVLMFPLVFALYFDETGSAPVQLEAPTSFISATDPTRRVFSWASPDGLLEMEVSSEARIPWYLTETLNGVSIERHLLSDSLPQ